MHGEEPGLMLICVKDLLLKSLCREAKMVSVLTGWDQCFVKNRLRGGAGS